MIQQLGILSSDLPFDSAIDVSTHARPLNDALSTESLEIISGQSSVFLQNPLDTTRNPVLMETIDNGFVQQSNVLYDLPTTSVLLRPTRFHSILITM